VDETFIGGKEKNKAKHKRTKETQGRSCKTKTPVVGILRRGGEVRAMSVLNTSKSQLHSFIFDNVFPQTKLMTDEWKGYKGLSKTYEHSVIKHSQEEYVRGECHTNGIEGFWSLLKRSIIGVYHSMSKKHLDRYIDECCFRYNTHKMNDSDRFHKALSKINVRLKYSDLIAEY
jgi:transposase-like protein